MSADFQNLTLEHLRALRSDMTELKNDGRDVKAHLTVIRSYIADQHAEQNLLNSRIAALELEVDRLKRQFSITDAE